MSSIAKTYDPGQIEDRWYSYWIAHNYFHAEPDTDREPYCIVLPPPNVTGILHMGHALQSSIQDTLIRYNRMRGKSALWMPGTDHAGIATQNVVEAKLREDGIDPQKIGRDAFVKEVWKWKEKHGNIIREQQQRLGSSCDWERERFTMDEGLSHAVRTVFVTLFEQGLIYRGKYIVNWCPFHKTALSDEEVKYEESEGSLWYMKYPFENEDDYITVATTRPETMLGDTAVAVNPDDERYKDAIGKTVLLPLLNRKIPVIADEFVDENFGTGAVKVTPAHDPNDFDIGQRHDLPQIIVIDDAGCMTPAAGTQFRGLERHEARKKVVAALDDEGLLEKVEPHIYSLGKCYRCSTTIEPLLSDQWFLKMAPLAEKAIAAVRKKEIVFYPKKWERDFFYWMENIRDWCISRQLWWGHRIPVWYCTACGSSLALPEDPTACTQCGSTEISQDEDVLDTWFSSWLWPFSTLGWPQKTPEMGHFYPTAVLVSGYDILFFWIARMIMAGLWFTGEKPFSHVYITGMIKDELGRIMSKSLGNGIDPLEMVDKYGADAVRYSLVALSTEGQDIKLSPQKFEAGRNYANKIWNAYRFLKLKESEFIEQYQAENGIHKPEDLSDSWILSRLHSTWKLVDEKFRQYKLSEALNAVYAFLWHDFCDWYIEILKDRLQSGNGGAAASLFTIALPTLKKTMELLHPFMPFITEEIWQNIDQTDGGSISITNPGSFSENLINTQSEADIAVLQQIIYAVRNIRGEMNVPPTIKADVLIRCDSAEKQSLIKRNSEYLYRLGGIGSIDIGPGVVKPPQSAAAVADGMEIYIPLADLINIENERERLTKEAERLNNQLHTIHRKLSNREFLKKAPPEVVERERVKLETFSNNLDKVRINLNSLES